MPLLLISGIAAGSQALLGAGQMISGYSKQRKADIAAEDAIKNLVSIKTKNKLRFGYLDKSTYLEKKSKVLMDFTFFQNSFYNFLFNL